jgi:hypothetical protein
LLDRRSLLVQDEIQAQQPAEVWWFMHTPATIQLVNDGRVALLEQHGHQVHAEILSPAQASFQIMDAQPLTTSPHPQNQAVNEGIRKLAIRLKDITSVRLVVALTPESSSSKSLSSPPKLSALTSW